MHETGNDHSTRVYLPAARWHALLRGLECANQTPHDQAAALRGVIEFLDAVPAVRESGITEPLHQLLAALPDLLRVAGCWNQLTAELVTPRESDETLAETATAQLRAMLRFASNVAGEPITKLLMPLSELQAEADLEVQRGRDLVPGSPC